MRSKRLAVSLILVFAILGVLPATAEVRWKNGQISEATPLGPAELSRKMAELSVRDETRRVVVHLARPADPRLRAELDASGVRLLGYLGDRSYFASLTESVNPLHAAAVDGLIGVEAVAPVNKLHPDLAGGVLRPWAIVSPDKLNPVTKPGEPAPDPLVAVYVMFHPDAPLESTAAKLIGSVDGTVESTIKSAHAIVAHLRASRINVLAAHDAVMYIEPPLPPLSEINDSNRPRVEADIAQAPPYDLSGSGVTVLVYDGGQMFAHGDFGTRLTVGPTDTSGISDHATHVGGTIGGDGSGSAGQYMGMAPAVDFISYGFEQEGGLSEGFLYTDPGDIEADYGAAINTFGADVSNNSIGTNTAPNGYPCDWEGNYGATGVMIDSIARGFFGEPFRIVWANGNERGSGRCGTTYVTTAPPACAKNHITVGAMNSNDDSVTSFTSWGPCDDGRIKPDISAPGCQSDGDNGVTSTSSSGGYTNKCGTSMAAPTATGVVSLMLEQFRRTFPATPDPRNATVKAILATTAVDLHNPGPDYQTGYGSIRTIPAVDLIAEERFIEDEVGQGEVYSFVILVDPGDPELKVTIAWDDAPGTPNVDPVLVNDLDLRVIGPDGTTYLPWTLDPANPAGNAVQTVRDGLNNIEQVAVLSPSPGAYRVEVEGFNIASGVTQSFGAAATPSLINCAPTGILAANTTRISCSDDLVLDVIDCDLNTDDGVVESVVISVNSTTEPAGESLTLIESAPETAAFSGTISVSTADAAGVLWVTEGDTITATYIDADDGLGGTNVPVTRNVIVDCTAPVVLGTNVLQVNPRDATVEVTADEPVRLTLRFGTVCGMPDDFVSTFGLNTTHQVNLRNLQDDTSYYYTIEVADEAGNSSVDDNGGACYSFSTPQIPDFFTEQFSGGLDLVGQSLTFTPNGSVDFYGSCIEPLLGALPTDPTGGTDLALTDDQPVSQLLTGGMVELYGVSYDTVHIGPNGYVTFGAGDSSYTESFADHFDTPRVAALFDDLNPTAGGFVSWLELPDRAVATWEGVAEYSTTNSNTFQIELFFDGRIRISWLQVDVADAIVGLSNGSGVDPDFYETDLSASGNCGPRPPIASGQQLATGPGVSVPIALVATDDGLPAPPALSYRLRSLPLLGTLTDDGSGLPISYVPYLLSGPAVTYTPAPNYEGADQFTFDADDGGVAPDGGRSNLGTVSMTIGAPGAIHEFLVDDTDPGWTMTGQWAFGQPTGGGSHDLDPTGGATGLNVLGYNLDGDYPDSMAQPEMLTSTAIDLRTVSGATLEFQRWLGIESASYDHATVELSPDGGLNWTVLWDHTGAAISESAWSLQTYDISALADDQFQVMLRFTIGVTDGSVTYPGWNIDDIRITGNVPVACNGGPAEVDNVTFGADTQTIFWTPPAIGGGDPPAYDVVRSTDVVDFVSGAVCIETDDATDTQVVTSGVPASGQLYFYLVRAENDCGIGSVGQQTDGAPRTAPSCSP